MRGVYKHGWMDVLYDTVSSMKKYRKNTQMDVYIITPFQNSSCSSSILPSHQLIRPNQKSLVINSRTLVFRACIFIDNKVWMLRKRRVYVPRLYVKTINATFLSDLASDKMQSRIEPYCFPVHLKKLSRQFLPVRAALSYISIIPTHLGKPTGKKRTYQSTQ